MEGQRLDELDLPLMVDRNTDANRRAFTVSIDAGIEHGVTTGISAEDRRHDSGGPQPNPHGQPNCAALGTSFPCAPARRRAQTGRSHRSRRGSGSAGGPQPLRSDL